jgi:hypothetical protein
MNGEPSSHIDQTRKGWQQRFVFAVHGLLAIAALRNARAGTPAHVGLTARRASSARIGACGAIEATNAAAGVPSRLVSPQAWKKHFALRGPGKEPSRQLVISRLPQQTGYFARKADHGRAEAVLIALYGLDVLERERGLAKVA